METEVLKIVKKFIPLSKVPDGEYSGCWGAYTVKFASGNIVYELTTVEGIRSINTPCTVTVANGEATVRVV